MRIVITGAGIVSAIGTDKAETLRSLQQERSGVAAANPFFPAGGSLPVGAVPLDNAALRQRLGLAPDAGLPRNALLALWAAREALDEAALTRGDYARIAFLNGTTVGGMDLTERHYAGWLQGAPAEALRWHDAGASTRAVADCFGGFARSSTVSTACSSALNAIAAGADLLRTGKAELVLAGGTESLTRFHFEGFRSLMITDASPCRPFCATRTGLNLGEGAAYLVLETEESARRRNVRPLAWLSGYGNACDAFHQTASSDSGEGAFLAMRQALEEARLQPSQIDYINAHGTGTPNNDASEAAAMHRLFGSSLPPFSSTKAFTGHTTSASGAIEAVVCLLAMQNGFLPANLNWRTPMPCGSVPVLRTAPATLRHVLCNAFGFGGNCTAVVFSACGGTGMSVGNAVRYTLQSDVTLTGEADTKAWLTPMESRRLTPAMRKTLAAALQALHEAGITCPDAVITGTRWGCICNSRRLLDALCNADGDISPTLFMQSTHNTVSSLVAIRLRAHGYNCTWSHGEQSFRHALSDAVTQMELGRIRNALVIGFDETDATWSDLLRSIGSGMSETVRAVVLTLNASPS